MKALDNPLESTARKEMAPKHAFLLLLAFEGAVRLQDWTSLSGIIKVIRPPSSTLFPLMPFILIAGCGDSTVILAGF